MKRQNLGNTSKDLDLLEADFAKFIMRNSYEVIDCGVNATLFGLLDKDSREALEKGKFCVVKGVDRLTNYTSLATVHYFNYGPYGIISVADARKSLISKDVLEKIYGKNLAVNKPIVLPPVVDRPFLKMELIGRALLLFFLLFLARSLFGMII